MRIPLKIHFNKMVVGGMKKSATWFGLLDGMDRNDMEPSLSSSCCFAGLLESDRKWFNVSHTVHPTTMPPSPTSTASSKPLGGSCFTKKLRREQVGLSVLLLEKGSKEFLTWYMLSTRGLDYLEIGGLSTVPIGVYYLEVLSGRGLSGTFWWSKKLSRKWWRFKRPKKSWHLRVKLRQQLLFCNFNFLMKFWLLWMIYNGIFCRSI